jgi:hypothetical protein
MTKYATWQGKRHKSFGPAQIDAAVTEFLDGPWAEKSDRFVLCVQARLRSTDALDKIEECAARFAWNGHRVPTAGRGTTQSPVKIVATGDVLRTTPGVTVGR